MGRKIPVRKYRGKIKDPLKLIATRESDASINAAPKDRNAQELPKKVEEIKRLCELVKKGQFSSVGRKKRKRRKLLDSKVLIGKDPRLPGMKRPDSEIPRIKQQPGESHETYFQRFCLATQDFVTDAQLEETHEVEIKRDSDGEITSFEKDFSSVGGKKTTRPLKERRRKGKINQEPKKRLSKVKRDKLRNKSRGGDNLPVIDFSMLKDEVKFGEVVHKPPQLKIKPKGSLPTNRPGIKDLLLKKMIPENTQNKSQRKKSMSLSLERERSKIIAAYREMKSKKNQR